LARNLNTGKQGEWDVRSVITYFGPAFVFRLPFNHNSCIFTANAGMGYIEYREKMKFVGNNGKTHGADVGLQMGFGLEYKITPQFGLGINMLATTGQILTFNTEKNGVKSKETYEAGKGEGLIQIRLGAGIRFYIK
jgi:hypothetical protein